MKEIAKTFLAVPHTAPWIYDERAGKFRVRRRNLGRASEGEVTGQPAKIAPGMEHGRGVCLSDVHCRYG